jgi:hypothetical protein
MISPVMQASFNSQSLAGLCPAQKKLSSIHLGWGAKKREVNSLAYHKQRSSAPLLLAIF